eukprot:gene2251-2023_t
MSDSGKPPEPVPEEEAGVDVEVGKRKRGEETPGDGKGAAEVGQNMVTIATRSRGVYMPPHRLRAMEKQMEKGSAEYQKIMFDALKKSINSLINKVSKENIQNVVMDLFQENLDRGRGWFCRTLMKSQAASPLYSPILSSLASVVNSKIPEIGMLLVSRIVIQFRKAYKRNDK